MIHRTILEWQRIAYGNGEHEIPEWAADRLVAVAQSSPLDKGKGSHILSHGRYDLRAGQVVGVIAAEDCTLEILPKIDETDGGAGDSGQTDIRRQLIHMLAVAFNIDIDSGRVTHLGYQQHNLLEILIGLFASKLVDAVRLGLPRKYTTQEDNLSTLRGRLDIARQFTTLAATPQRLACRYDALSPDISINQIMKAAVTRLARLARSTDNCRVLRELAFTYADIANVPAESLCLDQVVLDRTNKRWHDLISMAKLLLGQRFQTTTRGDAQGFSLLFEMNKLFEEYVARMLGRGLIASGLCVHRQGGRLYCLTELNGAGRQCFQTIPDILVKRGRETLLVMDTKWKRLSARIDDLKQGISQADVYQMLAYSRIYRCPQLMLLYPHHAKLGGPEPITVRYRVTNSNDELTIATIDISKSTGLPERLAALVGRQLAYSADVTTG